MLHIYHTDKYSVTCFEGEEEMKTSLPFHLCYVQNSLMIFNRLYTLLHGCVLIALIYYRAFSLFEKMAKNKGLLPNILIPYVLVFGSEIILSFLWLLSQAYRWRPVTRTVFPERLPVDDKLPGIDVFICTADPNKESSVDVMNTVISAMALDYPPDKLHVYLSDDAGSSVTLKAIREAWKFARLWLPFCKKYRINIRCPQAYFSRQIDYDEKFSSSLEFISDNERIKKQFEMFKERVNWIKENSSSKTSKDHPISIEVITSEKGDPMDAEEIMPFTVYVSREKRPSHPHHFKAGALNVLLRVSSMLSNSPYILVLDCDMYCNDASSARQAMCFHLDPQKSPKLAWVQFPQNFHNVLRDKDIYDSQIRNAFTIYWPGKDGLGGPTVSGTGFFITREALYASPKTHKYNDLGGLQKLFGPSLEFIRTFYQKNITDHVPNGEKLSSALIQELVILGSCTFENDTKWGKEVGFRYLSVLEDYFTGLSLHCKGYISVYYNPVRPAFLGSATTNLSELLVQNTRWCTGLVEVGISKYSPLIYGPPRMSFLLSLCYADIAYLSFFCFPLWCLGIVPQLCLIQGISLYPGMSSPFYIVFVFLFLSSNLKHIQEVYYSGHSIRTWIYEQRMWMIKAVTCYTYGTLNAILEKIGRKEASFLPTNKVDDEEQLKRYQSGIYDFQVPTMFMSPICTVVILNLSSLLLGGVKIFCNRNFDEMSIQAFISFFILIIQYPVIEGMFFRKDSGRVQPSVTLLSAALVLVILCLGTVIIPSHLLSSRLL